MGHVVQTDLGSAFLRMLAASVVVMGQSALAVMVYLSLVRPMTHVACVVETALRARAVMESLILEPNWTAVGCVVEATEQLIRVDVAQTQAQFALLLCRGPLSALPRVLLMEQLVRAVMGF